LDAGAGPDAPDMGMETAPGNAAPDGASACGPCDPHAYCSNADGGVTCTCPSGYQGDGSVCTPVVDPCVVAGTCPDGIWLARTLPGLTASDTVEAVLADPARPSDFYAFVGSNSGPTIKVYRSTDFGDTWANVNTTNEITGNPWGASIDPNPNRDPGTPPTMWSPSGYGAVGAWKSTDRGATWVRSVGADMAFGPYNPFGATLTDLYHIRILPDDPPNHVLATYHYAFANVPDGGFGETWDGGQTWVIHLPPTGIGTSHYVIPISGTTWAVIAQSNNGASGIWRTTTAGRVGGTPGEKYRDGTISTAAWTKVDSLEHVHGSHENLVLTDGTILVTGETSGAISTDQGATWTHFTDGSWAPPHQFNGSDMSNIAVTDRFIYTNFLATGNPDLARAPRANPVGAGNWDLAYAATPSAMTEGGAPFGSASSYNSSIGKWVVLAGTYNSGIWKYIEPR
jgi:hypothetical protein